MNDIDLDRFMRFYRFIRTVVRTKQRHELAIFERVEYFRINWICSNILCSF